MFKNYLFVTPSCVHSIDHKRPERHLKMCWSQVSIAFTRYLWYWTAFFQCLAHNTSDVMRMHNRVLLVILGTFLFTIAKSNEIVSTIMYSKWIANEYMYIYRNYDVHWKHLCMLNTNCASVFVYHLHILFYSYTKREPRSEIHLHHSGFWLNHFEYFHLKIFNFLKDTHFNQSCFFLLKWGFSVEEMHSIEFNLFFLGIVYCLPRST